MKKFSTALKNEAFAEQNSKDDWERKGQSMELHKRRDGMQSHVSRRMMKMKNPGKGPKTCKKGKY